MSTKKRSKLKLLAAAAGGLVVIGGVLLAFAPSIASRFAPGIVESAAADAISGSVKVGSTTLSWNGPQKLTSVQLFDPDLKEVLRANITANASLLSLVRGSYNIGEITIDGKALVVRDEKGVSNLQRAIAPRNPTVKSTVTTGSAPQPTGGPRLPAGLAAKVVLAGFDISYSDPSLKGAMVSLPNLKGEAEIGTGKPITLDLTTDLVTTGAAKGTSGALSVHASIDKLIDADGSIHPDKAQADVKARGSGVPVAALDAIAGQGGKLTRSLGATLDAGAELKGDYSNGTAVFSLSSANHVVASGSFSVKAGVLKTETPITAAIPGASLIELMPSIRESLKAGNLELSAFPDAALRIESVVVKLPTDALDLRSAGLVAKLQTTPIQGVLRLEGQAPKRVNIDGLNLSLVSLDFAKDLRAVATCNASIDGQSAGTIDTDLTVGGLLDAKGALKGGMPGKLDGKMTVKSASTAIIQPFVSEFKLMPKEDIGQTLNAELIARTPRDPARGGYDIDIRIGSDRLSADGAFAVTETSIQSLDRPFSMRLLSAGAIAHRFQGTGGWHLQPTGAVDVVLKDVNLPLRKDASGRTSVDAAGASAGLVARFFGMELAPPVAQGAGVPVKIGTLDVGFATAPKATPRLTLKGDLSASGAAFTVEGDLALDGLIQGSEMVPAKIAPQGRLTIRNVPAAIAANFNAPAVTGKPTLDLGTLTRDLIGPTISADVTLASVRDKGATDVTCAITSAQSTTAIDARITGALAQPTQADIKRLSTEITLQPAALESALVTLMPDLKERPRLVEPSQIRMQLEPVVIPLAANTPLEVSKLGAIKARVQIPGRTMVRGLSRTDQSGHTIAVAPAGLESLELTVNAPASIAVSSGAIELAFKTRLLSEEAPGGTLASLSGTARTELLAPPKEAGASRLKALAADLKVEGVAAAAVDSLSGHPGMLAGLLGDTLSADLKVASTGDAAQTLTIDILPKAPRLSVSQPVHISVQSDRVVIANDTRIDLQLTPAFANAYVFKPDASGKNTISLLKPTQASVTVSKLTFSKDDKGGGPLKKGVFEAALKATVPSSSLALADGAQMSLGAVSVVTNADRGGGPLTFSVDVDSGELKPTRDAATEKVQKLSFAGSVENLADDMGRPNLDRAIVNANANIPAFPTAVIDSLAHQGGLLNEALGPVVTASLKAEHVAFRSQAGAQEGLIDFSAQSPRATVKLKGSVKNGVFTSTTPAEIKFVEVTPELSGRVSRNIPFIGAITKSKDLKPGLIQVRTLNAPLDGDLTKLDADITIDLGEALIAPGGLINELLSVKIPAITGAMDKVGLTDAKKVGDRLKPVPVVIRSGVMNIEQFKLPLGEFEIENSGSIDLAHRQVDAVVWIPFGRLAAEAIPGLNSGLEKIPVLGGITRGSFNEVSMVPFRITGSMDGKLAREFSSKLFLGRVGNNIKDGNLLKDAAKDIGDLFKKKKDPKEEPPKK